MLNKFQMSDASDIDQS